MHMNGAEPQSESCLHGEPTGSFCAELPELSLPHAVDNAMHVPKSTMSRWIISSSPYVSVDYARCAGPNFRSYYQTVVIKHKRFDARV